MSATKMDAMWDEALTKFEQTTKKNIKDLPRPHSAEDLLREVQHANSQYESFRNKSKVLLKLLSAIAKPIELVGQIAADAASTAFPPSSVIFSAAMYLIGAAKGVSAILEAISDLLARLQDFCVRLKVYDKTDLSPELREKLTEVLVTLIEVLAKSTKKVKDPRFRLKAYTKNLLLGNDVEMQSLLKKLELLTRSENSLVGAETYAQVKSTGKTIESLEASLAAIQASADQNSQIITNVKASLDKSRAELKAEKELGQVEALKHVLSPSVTVQTRLEQIRRERRVIPHSGDWIVAEDHFSSWATGNGLPLLWITGNPGSGKTFLTYNIVTCLQKSSRAEFNLALHDVSVGLFFFQDNSNVTQSFRQALCDVAYQLTKTDPLYAKHLLAKDLTQADLGSIDTAWKMLFEDYWLSDEPSNSAYIVLDGLDEASSQERETFFELLQDVEDLGVASKLRVVMTGRPHVVQEMTLQGLREPPTVYVDSTKNGADITLYVRSSVAESQALRGVSKNLRKKIVETLVTNAEGMFMWVKLMIAELNRKAQRSRESEVERVLSEAPKGLSEMIKHVLEGFANSLPPDEAEDLNVMLRWVALARRPLCLGELDAALRLQSEDGSGLLSLENTLRKPYASLFTLSREDDLTTSELLNLKQHPDLDDDGDSESWDAVEEDEVNLNSLTDFNSNPQTTTVSFSHASILDYVMSLKHGRVTSPDSGDLAIGLDLRTDQIAVAEACIDIILDETYRDRMKGSMNLLEYAQKNWIEHLQTIEYKSQNDDSRFSIGKKLVQMLHDNKYIESWIKFRDAHFFTADAANALIPWLQDPIILAWSDDPILDWLNASLKGEPVEIFEHTMRYVAKLWLSSDPKEFNVLGAKIFPQIIYFWLVRRRGETSEGLPDLAADEILGAAEFAGFKYSAEHHRRLAMSLRMHGHKEEAKLTFEKVLALDPNSWRARAGISEVLLLQGMYQQALETDEALLKTLEVVPAEELTSNDIWVVHQRMAICYMKLGDRITELPSDAVLELDVKACKHYFQAFLANRASLVCFGRCLWYWHMWISYGLPYRIKFRYTNRSDVPPPDQCYKEIMGLVHNLHDHHVDDQTHWLWDMGSSGVDAGSVIDSDLDNFIVEAANKNSELRWIQERYEEAILRAQRALRPTLAAELTVTLAEACELYGHDSEKAQNLLESLLSERVFTARNQTKMMKIKKRALELLGDSCLRNALNDESQSGRYIGKLEGIWKRSRELAALLPSDAAPPPNSGLSLGVWYTKLGRHQEVLEMLKPHVKEACAKLSSKNPMEKLEGYLNLADALIVVRDDKNTIAVLQCLRRYRDGVAVLSSDRRKSDDNGPHPHSTERSDSARVQGAQDAAVDEDNDDDNDDVTLELGDDACYGPCDCDFYNFDNTFICRYELRVFCAICYERMFRTDDPLVSFKCSLSHEWLEVPPLTTRFRKGEIVVDGVVVNFDIWKQEIADAWGL